MLTHDNREVDVAARESYLETVRQRFESMPPERRASLEEWWEQCLRQRRLEREYRDWAKKRIW